jgi:hypothetical protein
MPRLVGFNRFDALLEEQIDEKISRRILSGDQGMVVWWSIGAGHSTRETGGLIHVGAGVARLGGQLQRVRTAGARRGAAHRVVRTAHSATYTYSKT